MTLTCNNSFICGCVVGANLVGSLAPPSSQSSQSPGGSPTKHSHSHSAHTSPTNTAKLRPRARSAESDSKKLVSVNFTQVVSTNLKNKK